MRVAVLLSVLVAAFALYEEQAGQIDWYREQVGNIRFLGFHSAKKTVYVGSESGMVAALKSRTGEIAWRQALPEGETPAHIAFDGKHVVYAASEEGIVRAFQAADGTMIWESATWSMPRPLQQRSSPLRGILKQQQQQQQQQQQSAIDILPVPALKGSDGEASDVIVRHRTKVTRYGGSSSGKQYWTWQYQGADSDRLFLAVKGSGKAAALLFVVAVDEASIEIFSLDMKTGEERDRRLELLSSRMTPQLRSVALTAQDSSRLVLLDGENLVVFDLVSGEKQETGLQSLLPGATGVTSIGRPDQVQLSSQNGAAIVRVPVDAAATVVATLPAGAKCSGGVTPKEHVLCAIAQEDKNTLEVSLVAAAGKPKTLARLDWTERGGAPEMVWSESFKRGGSEGGFGFFALIAGKDHSLHFVQSLEDSNAAKETAEWVREEALASITAAQFADLPAGSKFAERHIGYPGFLARIGPQLAALSDSVRSVLTSTTEAFFRLNSEGGLLAVLTGRNKAAKKDGSSGKPSAAVPPAKLEEPFVRDTFGFRKVLLAATASGAVYGLDTLTGAVVWLRYLPASSPASTRLFVTGFHQAILLLPAGKTRTEVLSLDPLTGTIQSRRFEEGQVIHASLLPLHFTPEGGERTQLLLAVYDDLRVEVYPEAGEAHRLLHGWTGKVVFQLADASGSALHGYAVVPRSGVSVAAAEEERAAAGADDDDDDDPAALLGWRAVKLWTIDFAAEEQETISGIAPARTDAVQSRFRSGFATGGEIRYKYLNPSLIAVATVRGRPPAGKRQLANVRGTVDPSVMIYLIDGVTGNIVHRVMHRQAEGPVNIVQSENLIVYHFFDRSSNQYQLSSIELTEADGKSNSSGFSSFAAAVPDALQQSYVFRASVRAMGVTATQKGITTKDILFGLTSGQVLEMPRSLVDPRRPLEPPAQGSPLDGPALPPYTKELPLDTRGIITHRHTVANLRAVDSAPTDLESTTLVLAYGTDMFLTRVTPSHAFDQLSDEFNHPFLIVTVSLLAVATVVAGRWASRKKLAMKWS